MPLTLYGQAVSAHTPYSCSILVPKGKVEQKLYLLSVVYIISFLSFFFCVFRLTLAAAETREKFTNILIVISHKVQVLAVLH